MVTACCGLFLPASGAHGAAFAPPGNQIYAGVAGPTVASYQRAVGKHPAVYEDFVAWGEYLPVIFENAPRSRLMVSITTASGSREMITPGGIARGEGDRWLIALSKEAFDSGRVTYVRLMAEMDAYWNPYGAFGSDGSQRDADHSTSAFRRAWKRAALILRGGRLASIDATLRRLGMPALRTNGDLPRPKVALVWCPQVAGAPDVAGNQPRDYWPGDRWVDWVATDFYANAPNFAGLQRLYAAFPREPFAFGEYALWGSDDPGWVDRLFGWVRGHARARMLIYNQGVRSDGPFRLSRYPRAAAALRHQLASARFPAYP